MQLHGCGLYASKQVMNSKKAKRRIVLKTRTSFVFIKWALTGYKNIASSRSIIEDAFSWKEVSIFLQSLLCVFSSNWI